MVFKHREFSGHFFNLLSLIEALNLVKEVTLPRRSLGFSLFNASELLKLHQLP